MRTFKRLLHCVGCGNRLENLLQTAKYVPLEAAASNDARIAEQIESGLSEVQMKSLDWKKPSSNGTNIERRELARLRAQKKLEKAQKSDICYPCALNKSGSKTVLNPTSFSYSQYVSELKTQSQLKIDEIQVVHVIDAHDFPTGVPLEYRPGDLFVVNRCDLVSPKTTLQQLKSYYMREQFNQMGVNEANVVTTSLTSLWNLRLLADKFKRFNVFVGNTNAGKTALVNYFCGIDKRDARKRVHTAATASRSTWPVPYTTQTPRELRALPTFNSVKLVDTPSIYKPSFNPLLSSKVIRKVNAGVKMHTNDFKYGVPQIKMSTGQVATVGGLFALEFPKLMENNDSVPVHVHVGVGGVAHSQFATNFKCIDKVFQLNNRNLKVAEKYSVLEPQTVVAKPGLRDTHFARMHTVPGLELAPVYKFKPGKTLAVHSLGFIHPHIFAPVPADYEITVWAPRELENAFTTRDDTALYLKRQRKSQSS